MSMRDTFRVLGTTDDVTTCDICGREDLKSTVVLSTGEAELYAGSDCASRLTGFTVKEIHLKQRTSDRERRESEEKTRRAVRAAQCAIELAEFREWIYTTHGIRITTMGDLMDQSVRLGRSPISYRQEWKTSKGAA
jgi:hypothetical protein